MSSTHVEAQTGKRSEALVSEGILAVLIGPLAYFYASIFDQAYFNYFGVPLSWYTTSANDIVVLAVLLFFLGQPLILIQMSPSPSLLPHLTDERFSRYFRNALILVTLATFAVYTLPISFDTLSGKVLVGSLTLLVIRTLMMLRLPLYFSHRPAYDAWINSVESQAHPMTEFVKNRGKLQALVLVALVAAIGTASMIGYAEARLGQYHGFLSSNPSRMYLVSSGDYFIVADVDRAHRLVCRSLALVKREEAGTIVFQDTGPLFPADLGQVCPSP